MDSYRVLFVCTGNTCRSPLAECILTERLLDAFDSDGTVVPMKVASAGTHAADGLPASEYSIAVAADHGIDISHHRSRHLTPELAAGSDLILTMGHHHAAFINDQMPGITTVSDIKSYGYETPPPSAGAGIPDPIGMGRDTYARVYDELEREIARIAPQLFLQAQRKATG